MKKGFTLIELLVVVLIIGILSAVALPQYTKAVTKARFTEALTLLKSMKVAKDVCFLERGEACGFSEMDIDFPNVSGGEAETKNFNFQSSDAWNGIYGPVAGYKKEKVCLCYYDENGDHAKARLVLSQGGGGCSDNEPTMDYAKLLNIPEVSEDECGCC